MYKNLHKKGQQNFWLYDVKKNLISFFFVLSSRKPVGRGPADRFYVGGFGWNSVELKLKIDAATAGCPRWITRWWCWWNSFGLYEAFLEFRQLRRSMDCERSRAGNLTTLWLGEEKIQSTRKKHGPRAWSPQVCNQREYEAHSPDSPEELCSEISTVDNWFFL